MANEQSEQPVTESSLEESVAAIYNREPAEEPETPEVEAQEEEAVEDDAPAEASAEDADDSDGEAPSELTEIDIPGIGPLRLEGLEPEQIQALKDGFLRQDDYTKKTTEVSQTRQALELQAQEYKRYAAEQEYTRTVADEQAQLGQLEMIASQYDQLDWASMDTDEMVRTKHQVDQLEKERNRLIGTLQQKQQQWIEQRKADMQEYLQKGRDYLNKSVGKWDEEVAASTTNYMLDRGIPEAEVRSLTNPLYVEAFAKAMKWDQLRSQTKGAVKKANESPTIAPKATGRKMPDDVKAKLNFKKRLDSAKDSRAAADIIQEQLAKRYGAR